MHDGRRRCGFSLIEILVVVVILAIMLVIVGQMISGSKGKDPHGKSPIQKAQGTVCLSNLNQLRQGIQLLRVGNENEAPPQSLAELKFPSEVLQCPDGKVAYVYDPASGGVSCPTLGHERY